MNYFRRGNHRAHKHSQSVYELIAECRRYDGRIPIYQMFAINAKMWDERGETWLTITPTGGLASIPLLVRP